MGAVDILTPDRKETQEYLSNTLKKCLNGANKDHKLALKNLTECMRQHSSWYGNHKSRIEPFLLQFLEWPDKDIVKEAAVAFHFFQQTGSAGTDGINYSNNFLNQFTRLCATVHALYDELFENETEVVQFRKIDAKPFDFSPYRDTCNLVDKQQIVSQKITNCLVYLKAMVLESYPVNKPSIPEYLVSIVERGLSLHLCLGECAEEEISPEMRASSRILSEVQAKLLHFLKYVIKGSRVGIFAHTITTMLVNTLKKSHSCNCFPSHFRITTYKVLLDWIPVVADSNQNLQETLIPLITRDIIPQKAQVSVRVPQKSKSKKRKHKSAIFAPQIEEKSSPAEDIEKQTRCLHALKVLNGLIECPHSPELTKIVTAVFTVLQEIHTMNRVPEPYTNVGCQAELYATLVALYAQQLGPIEIYHLNLPPIYEAIYFLTAGETSKCSKIVNICKGGLMVLEKIAHPECPSLNLSFPLQRKQPERIKILSDLVIRPPGVNGDENDEWENEMGSMNDDDDDDDVVRLEPDEVSESAIRERRKEEEKAVKSDDKDRVPISQSSIEPSSSSDDIIDVVDSSEEDEDKASTSAMEQEIDEPPAKKMKEDDDDDDDDADDMIAYFADGVNGSM